MADINKAILFTVGTIGTATAGKKFSSLHKKMLAVGAGVAIVSGAMVKLIADAQAFGESFQSVTTDMRDFNAQTNGMINTLDGLQGTVKLQRAGLVLTAEQLGAIGSAAASMSQQLGEGPEGATTRFNKLVKAVIKGSEGPLLEYGIQIDEQTDKVKAQAEVIGKLTDKYAGMVVKVRTVEQEMFSLKNSMDTVIQAEMDTYLKTLADDWANITIAISGGADALREYETEILNTGGAIVKWEQSWDGFFNKMLRNIDKVAMVAAALVAGPLGALAVLGASKLGAFEGITDPADAERAFQVDIQTRKHNEALQRRQSAELANVFIGPTLEQLEGPKKTGGGGGPKQLDPAIVEAAEAEIRALNAQFLVRFMEQAGTFGAINEALNKQNRLGGDGVDDRGRGASQQEAMEAAAAKGLEQQAAANILKEDQERNHLAVMLGLNKDFLDQQLQWQQMTVDQRLKATENVASESATILENFGKTANAESKKGFEVQKALMYSANIISTIQGAAGAFARVMSNIPPPVSFIMAPIAAASVAAMGAAAGANIRKQKFGGGGSAKTSTPSTPSFSGGSMGGGGGGGGDNFTFNVNVEGQTVFSSVMNANDIASQNGQKSFSTGE